LHTAMALIETSRSGFCETQVRRYTVRARWVFRATRLGRTQSGLSRWRGQTFRDAASKLSRRTAQFGRSAVVTVSSTGITTQPGGTRPTKIRLSC
jgi:hypothetical protein